MDEAKEKQHKRFLAFKITAVVGALLIAVVYALWYFLPIYAGPVVTEYSLWPDPIARVYLHEDIQYNNEYNIVNKSYLKLHSHFKDDILPTFTKYLKSSDEEHVEKSLDVLSEHITDIRMSAGGMLMEIITGGQAPVDISSAPALIPNVLNLVESSNDRLSNQAILLLADIGSSARVALPALENMHATETDRVKKLALSAAILNIRPQQDALTDVKDAIEIFKSASELNEENP